MAEKWVLVICPTNCNEAQIAKVTQAFEKIKAVGQRPFMFSDNADRRALEKDAIRRKFPDQVVFTHARRAELQELVSLARQYHLTK